MNGSLLFLNKSSANEYDRCHSQAIESSKDNRAQGKENLKVCKDEV